MAFLEGRAPSVRRGSGKKKKSSVVLTSNRESEELRGSSD